jgi:hypothetical protein
MHAVDRMAVENERRTADADPNRPANNRSMADRSAVKGRSIAADGSLTKGLSIASHRSLMKDLSIAADRSARSDMLRGGARRRAFVVMARAALSELREGESRGHEHQCRGNG